MNWQRILLLLSVFTLLGSTALWAGDESDFVGLWEECSKADAEDESEKDNYVRISGSGGTYSVAHSSDERNFKRMPLSFILVEGELVSKIQSTRFRLTISDTTLTLWKGSEELSVCSRKR